MALISIILFGYCLSSEQISLIHCSCPSLQCALIPSHDVTVGGNGKIEAADYEVGMAAFSVSGPFYTTITGVTDVRIGERVYPVSVQVQWL